MSGWVTYGDSTPIVDDLLRMMDDFHTLKLPQAFVTLSRHATGIGFFIAQAKLLQVFKLPGAMMNVYSLNNLMYICGRF